jgi:hypothetical protein
MNLSDRSTILAAAFAALVALYALTGCGSTSIERDGLTIRDVQFLRERSVGTVKYTRTAEGVVSLEVKDGKAGTTPDIVGAAVSAAVGAAK